MKSTRILQPPAVEMCSTGNFASQLRAAAMAENTRRAYDEGWRVFSEWCAQHNISPLAASHNQVADFFTQLAERPRKHAKKPLALGTLVLVRCAIRRHYADANRTSPTHHPDVGAIFSGLARLRGSAPRRVRALREYHINAMLACCPNNTIGKRDAALIAIGFSAALRRSELCALRVGDVEWVGNTRGKQSGIVLHIRRSKSDQGGAGQGIAVPEGKGIRPVKRLRRWLQAVKLCGATHQPLFQSMRRGGRSTGRELHHSDVARLVKYYAAQIGLDPAGFSAHSLRAGFVTSAAAHHARLDKIMAVTRHAQPATVMKYIRDADAFADHAGQAFL